MTRQNLQQRLRRLRSTWPSRAGLLMAAAGMGLGAALAGAGAWIAPTSVLAQGTPSLLEFRWDNNKDYRRLYYFVTDTSRLKRSEYYLILRPKDRKTAMLKLTVSVPDNFDSKIDPDKVKLCVMQEGGMLSRTRCKETIPAVIEVNGNGKSIEIFPERPVPVDGTIGVYMSLFNPFNIGMYQFNALAQAPGDVPFGGYLGSWLIQIDPGID
ncbi:DUF2808 domain-containing protein [Synechococcus sp. CS-205]|jgi:hypothetical protein|uniref:DUF2808 domain-containing protein n=1 Tax=Synechococcus sp. CS-205 TaxID=2847984 RepID=UPI00223B5B74|nr:DUF2808 domain-containing protein [Synechococcus sp. CS-205]MCT0248241.1 DUF2808 domain-containing protein [Synechococcus sp. CS-205]